MFRVIYFFYEPIFFSWGYLEFYIADKFLFTRNERLCSSPIALIFGHIYAPKYQYYHQKQKAYIDDTRESRMVHDLPKTEVDISVKSML